MSHPPSTSGKSRQGLTAPQFEYLQFLPPHRKHGKYGISRPVSRHLAREAAHSLQFVDTILAAC
jgi:hypothetical protein